MRNYIGAELYRNFNRVYLWLYTGVFAVLALAAVIILRANNVPEINLTSLTEMSNSMLIMPVFLVVAMIDMVTAEEQKNQTMRNTVTFGISRNKIILSKLIVTVILSLISAFIILALFLGSTTVLFGLGAGFPGVFLTHFLRIIVAVPLWIAAISVGNFLAIFISNSNIFAAVYGVVFLMSTRVLQVLGVVVSDKFEYARKYLITTQLNKLRGTNLTRDDMLFMVIIAIGYILIFTILSMCYFNKKEIK